MSATAVLAVRDAVVSLLNSTPLTQPFVAVAGYRPVYTMADLTACTVTVVPSGVQYASVTRDEYQADVKIDVGIQKAIASAESSREEMSELDANMSLVGEIIALAHTIDADGYKAFAVDIANEPVFSPEHLQDRRAFTSLVTFTYRVVRPLG